MHRLVLTGLVLVAFSLPALATDLALPRKAPPRPVPAPVFSSWSGFYVGATAGWLGSTNNNITASGFGVPGAIGVSHSGYIGGVEAGYNWQAGPNWVLGIEEDFQGVDANGSAIFVFPGNAGLPSFTAAYNHNINWLATVRGRIGFLSSPGLLWYGTGGLAYGQTKFVTTAACVCSTEGSTTNVSPGWTAGAGVEWKFAPAWSMKLEYLYVDLGTQTATVSGANGPFIGTLTSSVRETDNVVRFGLNYKLY